MSWWNRPTRVQTDAEKQAAWSNWSRAVGDGQFLTEPAGPTFLQRIANVFSPVEQRTITSLPWNVGSPLPSPAAAPSPDMALSLGAVYAAQSLIARTIAGLPLHAYRDVSGKKTELAQLPSLFDQPSVQGDLFDWLHRCLTSLLSWGNAYGLVTNRDGFGYPTGIEWLSPEHMTIVDFAFTGRGSFLDPVWRWRGRVIPKENLVHIPWFTMPWRVLGLSPLAAYAASVNTGLGAQKFSTDWFNNGGVPPGTFKNAVKTVPREEANEIKNRLTDSIRSHQPIVYGADWDYNPIAVNPQEAQFIETMKLTATQVAVIYGVPPDRIGGEKSSSLTYSTVEQDSIDFVQFTILNYARKLESAFFRILPAKQYVRFNLDALIRPDVKTRNQVYMLQRQMGLRNVDEIRDLENLPPLPNGEGQDYAPLLATGLAVDPEDQAALDMKVAKAAPRSAGVPMKAPGIGSLGEDDVPEVVKVTPRQPYKDTARNGR